MIAPLIRQAMVSWVLFMTAAFIEGIFRSLFLEPRLPGIATEILGIVVVLTTAVLIAYVFIKNTWLPHSERDLLLIGLLWVVFTVGFEFLFFHYAIGLSWNELLENYNVPQGHLYPIGLLMLLFTPFAVHRFRSTLTSAAGRS